VDQRRANGELARVDDRPLQPPDGRREAPDRKRISIRNPDGAAHERCRLERFVMRFGLILPTYHILNENQSNTK
jgi:hypothetical protein